MPEYTRKCTPALCAVPPDPLPAARPTTTSYHVPSTLTGRHRGCPLWPPIPSGVDTQHAE
eukprot:1256364-Pyramimonas_sp.AAC.1